MAGRAETEISDASAGSPNASHLPMADGRFDADATAAAILAES